MKTFVFLLALTMTTSLFGGMGVSKRSLDVQIINDSKTGDTFHIRYKDSSYQLVDMASLKHFTRSIYKAPTYSANSMDCDDLTMIFLGEFNRHLYRTQPASLGGYAIGEIYSHQISTGQYHVDAIVVTNIGTYVVMTFNGTIMRLRDYQDLYIIERIRI